MRKKESTNQKFRESQLFVVLEKSQKLKKNNQSKNRKFDFSWGHNYWCQNHLGVVTLTNELSTTRSLN